MLDTLFTNLFKKEKRSSEQQLNECRHEALLRKIKESEDVYIGEVYGTRRYLGGYEKFYPVHDNPFPSSSSFHKFKQSHIGEKHDGYIEIFGSFHKKENVIFYDSIYDKKRDIIRKRFDKSIKK